MHRINRRGLFLLRASACLMAAALKPNISFTKRAALVLVFLILPLAVTLAWGQAATGVLRGNIRDPQGLVLPGAAVRVQNTATGVSRQAISDDGGLYQFPQLSPGKYTLTVEMPGFKTSVQENIEVLVNTVATLDVTLELGEVTESVTVQASASQVNTQDATIGNAFNEMKVRQLPFNARNPVGLLSLQPGVNQSGQVTGARGDQNNITLDGVDVNDQQNAGSFTSVVPITLDSVQEFRVTTANPNATQGRSSGGQVALVTKSGSNQLHGSLYNFHRNTETAANSFFNNRNNIEKPALIRNVFGGSLGGPIVKDRAWFFYNYEGRQDRSGSLQSRIVPTEALKQGILIYEASPSDPRAQPCPTDPSRVCGILTPQDMARLDPLGIGVSPGMLKFFQSFPVGNDPDLGQDGGLAFTGFRFNAPVKVERNTHIARFDFDLTGDGKHLVFWRGSLADFRDTSTAEQFPGQGAASDFLDNSKGFSAAYSANISPTLLNEFRFGFTRQGVEFTGTQGDQFGVRDFSNNRSFVRAVGRQIPTYNIVNDTTLIKKDHTLQFGINFRFIENERFTFANSFLNFQINSGFMGDSLGRGLGDQLGSGAFADFPATRDRTRFARAAMGLLGTISQFNGTVFFDRQGRPLPFGQPQAREFGANEYEFYFQDSWQVRSGFTFTAGIRYSNSTVPWEKSGLQVRPTVEVTEWFNQRAANARAGIPSNASPLLGFDLAGTENDRPGFFRRDKNNFAPRIALAWSPETEEGVLGFIFGAKGRGVLRSGYSISYDRTGGFFAVQTDLSGAFGLASGFINPVSQFGFGFPGGLPPGPRIGSSTAALPPASGFLDLPAGGFPNFPDDNFSNTGFGIDTALRTPYQQSWNLTFERQLPRDFSITLSYAGRTARKLLTKSDLAAPINLFDPGSGVDYWTTLNGLIDIKRAGGSLSGPLPFIENIFPALQNRFIRGSASQNFFFLMDFFDPSWSDLLFFLDTRGRAGFGPGTFFQPQFNSLPFWRSNGSSNYHGALVTLRKRFSDGLAFDFNYSWSHAIDNASTVEASTRLGGQIANAFAPRDNIADSNFDIRQQINLNWVAELPFGRGKAIGGSASGFLNQVIGGWEFTGIFRWNTGLPVGVGNGFNFPTNFFLTGPGTRIAAVEKDVNKDAEGGPNLFADPKKALQAFDFTRPGSSGTRNALRADNFINLDFGVFKRFFMPFEGHTLQFRWEVFNATNTVRFTNPSLNIESPATFGRFTAVQGGPRVMQFALRYEF